MMFPSTTVLRLMDWIARQLGFDLGIRDGLAFDPLDEHEVSEQLHFGRD